jgi:hypothetical protein
MRTVRTKGSGPLAALAVCFSRGIETGAKKTHRLEDDAFLKE